MKVKFTASPIGGSRENGFGNFYSRWGVGICIVGVIGSIILGFKTKSFLAFLGGCIGTAVTSIPYFAFGEIFYMLQQIMSQNYDGSLELPKAAPKAAEQEKAEPAKSAPAEDTTVSADAVKNTAVSVNSADKKIEYHFPTRFADSFECPSCKCVQYPKRNVCWKCGAYFIYDDEEKKE